MSSPIEHQSGEVKSRTLAVLATSELGGNNVPTLYNYTRVVLRLFLINLVRRT